MFKLTIELDPTNDQAVDETIDRLQALRAPATETRPTVTATAVELGEPDPSPPAPVTETPAAPAATPPPPPPAQDPAPAAATDTPPPPPAGVELDSDGLPWDGRIHASTKTKLAKGGGWKKKRGVDPALVEQVEAELRGAMAVPAPATAAAEPPPAPAAQTFTQDPPPAPAAPAAPAAPVTGAPIPEAISFPELMGYITVNAVPDDQVQAAVTSVGLESLVLLAARPDLTHAVAVAIFPAGLPQ